MRTTIVVGLALAGIVLTGCSATPPSTQPEQAPSAPSVSIPVPVSPLATTPEQPPPAPDVAGEDAPPGVAPTSASTPPALVSTPATGSPAGPSRAATPPATSPAPTTSRPTATGSTFSFAVMPDTQNETTGSSTQFMDRARWIAANKTSRDIRFVTSSGDVHNWSEAEPGQLQVSSAGMKVIEAAGLPYTLALGNHDTAAVCPGGSACPGANTSVTVRNTAAFNRVYTAARYRNVQGAFQAGKVDNVYATYQAGGAQWMMLVLELWPRQQVIDWARQVVATHPKHNVIVVTHSYLEANGEISGSNGGYGATSPRHLFDSLIKAYPNIRMVFSGHVGNAASRVDRGNAGNQIVSFLQCFHSGSDTPLRMVQVDVARNTLTTSVINTRSGSAYPGTATTHTGMAWVK